MSQQPAVLAVKKEEKTRTEKMYQLVTMVCTKIATHSRRAITIPAESSSIQAHTLALHYPNRAVRLTTRQM